MRNLSLLKKFAVLSLVAFLLLGVALGYTLRRQVQEATLDAATDAAVLVARLGIQPHLTQDELEGGLPAARLEELDRILRRGLVGTDVMRIKIWNRDGEVVYSDDRSLVGRRFPPSPGLERALAGWVSSELASPSQDEHVSERGAGVLLEVYVPLQLPPVGAPDGAFEVYLPYEPLASSIERDTERLSIMLAGGLALLYVALFRIVAGASRRLRRQAEENRHQALHDALTGLPNRNLFHDRVHQSLLAARRDGGLVGVLLMDLDRFKEINETLGHHNGDRLLRLVGRRVRDALRESDTVARMGGDEFGVLLPELEDPGHAVGVAEKVLRALEEEPLLVNGLAIDVSASIGIAIFPEHGEDVDTLIQRADVAMYVAKETHAGHETYAFEQNRYSPARLALAGDLRRAIEGGQLEIYYQPKAEVPGGRVVGVEALVRWRHPRRGLLLPDEFIPLAEHTGLIRSLTMFVLDTSLGQLRRWHERNLPLQVAVNLSPGNLHDLRLGEEIRQLLARWGVEPDFLELEITESSIMTDPVRALRVLTELNDMGVRLAIDDFGTGYSSLAYLKQLPVDDIKIDKSFVQNMVADESDAMIVRSTIDLGRNLGLQVVAEGVETEEDLGAALGARMRPGPGLLRGSPPARRGAHPEARGRLDLPERGGQRGPSPGGRRRGRPCRRAGADTLTAGPAILPLMRDEVRLTKYSHGAG